MENEKDTKSQCDSELPSVGAPHIRQRLYFVADANGGESRGRHREASGTREEVRIRSGVDAEYGGGIIEPHELAKPVSVGRRGRSERPNEREIRERGCSEVQIEGSSRPLPDGCTGCWDTCREVLCNGCEWNCEDDFGSVADADGGNSGTERLQRSGEHGQRPQDGGIGQLADALPAGRTERRPESGNRPIAGSGGSGDELGNATSERLERPAGASVQGRSTGFAVTGTNDLGVAQGDTERLGCDSRLDSGEGISGSRNGEESGQQREISRFGIGERGGSPGPTNGFWRDAEWIYCRDGKWRPVGTIESGTFEMADELAADLGCVRHQSSGRYTISPLIEKGKGRVARLRGYGNAIVAEVAIAWIEAYLAVETQ